MDLTAYRAELERWSQAVAEIDPHGSDVSRLRQSLPQKWFVQARSERFEISTEWLSKELDAIEKNPAQAKSRAAEIQKKIAALLKAVNQFAAAPAPPVAKARADLDQILSRSEFRSMRGPSWFELMMERIGYWIGRMLKKIFGGLPGGTVGSVLAWVLVAIGFAGLAALVGTNLVRIARRKPIKLPAGTVSISAESRHWVIDAIAAAGRGDYRDAIHCAYWAAIAQMENLGMLPRDRSRTPRESLRLLSTAHNYSGALASVTGLFERVWYGFRPADSSDWAAVTAELEKMGCRLDSI